jgi:hypothetical protein
MDDLVMRLYEQADRRHGSIGSLLSLEWKAADLIETQSAEIRSLREQIWEIKCVCRTWDHPLATKILNLL